MLADFRGTDPVSDAELTYLQRRVYEEASAAVAATSTNATLIHVILATAYAKRLGEQSQGGVLASNRRWAEQHRVW